jgi:hypothetical protein
LPNLARPAASFTTERHQQFRSDNGSDVNIDGFNANEVVTDVNQGTITGNGHDISDGAMQPSTKPEGKRRVSRRPQSADPS